MSTMKVMPAISIYDLPMYYEYGPHFLFYSMIPFTMLNHFRDLKFLRSENVIIHNNNSKQ